MLTGEVYKKACERAQNYLERAGIVITEKEKQQMQVAEYGLGRWARGIKIGKFTLE